MIVPVAVDTVVLLLYLFPRVPGTDCSQCLAPSGTSSRDKLRQLMIVPVAVDTVVLLMMGVRAARNVIRVN